MNWNQHLSVCGDVIAGIEPGSTGSRVVGVLKGTIVVLLKEPKGEDWHKITKLSHYDIIHNLSSEHLNRIGMKIRHLCRKGVLK